MATKIKNEENRLAQEMGKPTILLTYEKFENSTEFYKTTIENVVRAEYILSFDPNYRKAMDVTKTDIYYEKNAYGNKKGALKYWGSTAYLCKLLVDLNNATNGGNTNITVQSEFDGFKDATLKNIMIDVGPNNRKEKISEFSFERIIWHLIHSIDAENSTHLASGNNYGAVYDKIINTCKNVNGLFDILKDKQNKGYNFLKELRYSGNNKKCLYSFATKFCHYVCFFCFKNKTEQDNYSIYDNIVFKKVKQYKQELNIDIGPDGELEISEEKKQGKNGASFDVYKNYSELIDKIIVENKKKGNGSDISRNGFDHLIWLTSK